MGDQPCPECAQMERRVLIGAILFGAAMGAAFVYLAVKK